MRPPCRRPRSRLWKSLASGSVPPSWLRLFQNSWQQKTILPCVIPVRSVREFSVPAVGFLDARLRACRCSKVPEVVLRLEGRLDALARSEGRWEAAKGRAAECCRQPALPFVPEFLGSGEIGVAFGFVAFLPIGRAPRIECAHHPSLPGTTWGHWNSAESSRDTSCRSCRYCSCRCAVRRAGRAAASRACLFRRWQSWPS